MMEDSKKITLYVVNTFANFSIGRRESGYYVLVHPQVLAETSQYIFRQNAPSRITAMRLMKTKNKVAVLDTMFGEGNWEIKFQELRAKNEPEALKKWTNDLVDKVDNKKIKKVDDFNIKLIKCKEENRIFDMDWMKRS